MKASSCALTALYSREELFAGLGGQEENFKVPGGVVNGVVPFDPTNTTALLVTLEKSEKHFSPATMYKDYAISTDEFAWDSQSATAPRKPDGSALPASRGARPTHRALRPPAQGE